MLVWLFYYSPLLCIWHGVSRGMSFLHLPGECPKISHGTLFWNRWLTSTNRSTVTLCKNLEASCTVHVRHRRYACVYMCRCNAYACIVVSCLYGCMGISEYEECSTVAMLRNSSLYNKTGNKSAGKRSGRNLICSVTETLRHGRVYTTRHRYFLPSWLRYPHYYERLW